jgi:hypothetical protein
MKRRGKKKGDTNGVTGYMRKKYIAKAEAEAKEIVKYMEKKGMFIPKDDYAYEAMEAVVAQVRMEHLHPKDKLAAARTVLEYTMAKPATESTVNVKKAEDFLSDLMTEMKDGE